MFVICQSTDGLPTFWAPSVGRQLGTPHSWSSQPNEALHFGRAQDAQLFADVFLPNLSPMLSIQAHTPQ